MHISEMKESRFLTKHDVGDGVLLTITTIEQENVAPKDKEEELKYCVSFEESEKPMVLNSTNAQLIALIAKSEETDDWKGTKIVLYNDPSISFGGKITGGIRVRAPKGQATKPKVAAKPATKPVSDVDDKSADELARQLEAESDESVPF